jgi:IS1 family transposase
VSNVGAKRRQRWTWYGYDRYLRKVVAFVNERRTDDACRQLLQKPGAAGSRVNTGISGSLTPSYYQLNLLVH